MFYAKVEIDSLNNTRERFCEYDSVFEACLQNSDPLIVAHALVKPVDNEIPVRIANFSDIDVNLDSGTLLGYMYSTSCSEFDDFQLFEQSLDDTRQTQSSEQLEIDHDITKSEVKKVLPPVDLSSSVLTPQQKKEVENLLTEYCDVFSSEDDPYGRCDLIMHTVDVGDSPPIKQRAYRTSPKLRTEIQKHIDKLLTHDIIEPSDSPWSSPLIMVKKKQVGNKPPAFRLVLDYRGINKVTKKDSTPTPLVSETIEALAGNTLFSTLDLTSGYHQIVMHPDHKQYTAFSDGLNLYNFKRLPMGMVNSGQTFSRLMSMVFKGMRWEKLVIYLDDICVFGKDFDSKLGNLRETFSRLRAANLKLSPEKCEFFKTEITFLGFLVNKDGVQPTSRNVDKIKRWPIPKNPTQVRGFCSLASFYRRFIANFSHICSPLYELTKAKVDFVWSDKCQQAFDTLKTALSSAPIVAHPRFDLPWTLYTDASNDCIGSVLAQVHEDGKERVVEYYSSKLDNTEQKWCTFDKEFYAIVASIRKFRHYLRDSQFTIVTDHRPLLALRKLDLTADYTGKRARWVLELDPLNWSIQYKPGNKHSNADSMSRYPHDNVSEHDNDIVLPDSDIQEISLFECFAMDRVHDDDVSDWFRDCIIQDAEIHDTEVVKSKDSASNDNVASRVASPTNNDNVDQTHTSVIDLNQSNNADIFTLHQDELRTQQQLDTDIQRVISWLKGEKPRFPKHKGDYIMGLWKQMHNLKLADNGILYRVRNTSLENQNPLQVVIPKDMIPSVLFQLHGSLLMGHSSAQTALRVARQHCYWPLMADDIIEFCALCESCQRHSNPVPAHKAPLLPIQAPRRRHIAIDITEMPVSFSGYRYILTVTDLFSKYLEMYPMKDQTALSVTKALFENYVPNHSLPISVHSDRGSQFEARVFKLLMGCYGIKKTRTTSYRPSANGQIERAHRDLKANITKRLQDNGIDQRNWDLILNHVKLCYNASQHSTTGFTPFFLETGEEPLLPIHILFNSSDPNLFRNQLPTDHQSYVTSLQQRLQTAYKIVLDNARDSKNKQAFYYDRSVRIRPYEIGDFVMRKNERRLTKLTPRWLGPFRIYQRSDDGRLYQVVDITKSADKPEIVHYDKLKPFYMSPSARSKSIPSFIDTSALSTARSESSTCTSVPGPSNIIPAPSVTLSSQSPPATPVNSPASQSHGDTSNSPGQGGQHSSDQSDTISYTYDSNSSSPIQASNMSNDTSFSPVLTSTPEPELTPTRSGRRRYRPLRLADFLTYE